MITLRELTPADIPAVRRIYSGASVRFTHARPFTIERARERVSRAVAAAGETSRSRWDFGIVHAQDLVGLISLSVRERGTGTLSYILREDTWGHGYATEAAHLVVAFAFTGAGTGAGLERLEAKHHPENPASGRVLAKVGFTPAGTVDLFGKDGKDGTVSYPVYGLRRPAVGSSTDRLP
ncbi:GNAT family N-acetyltransferase [Streptomyces sp. NPDC046203]|uniref:GNAT family N-acetyltransferase n=1 Tax=Streptomyces sp. NPDC046203 TaxID=3154602 RepID=UPI0033D91A3C